MTINVAKTDTVTNTAWRHEIFFIMIFFLLLFIKKAHQQKPAIIVLIGTVIDDYAVNPLYYMTYSNFVLSQPLLGLSLTVEMG